MHLDHKAMFYFVESCARKDIVGGALVDMRSSKSSWVTSPETETNQNILSHNISGLLSVNFCFAIKQRTKWSLGIRNCKISSSYSLFTDLRSIHTTYMSHFRTHPHHSWWKAIIMGEMDQVTALLLPNAKQGRLLIPVLYVLVLLGRGPNTRAHSTRRCTLRYSIIYNNI